MNITAEEARSLSFFNNTILAVDLIDDINSKIDEATKDGFFSIIYRCDDLRKRKSLACHYRNLGFNVFVGTFASPKDIEISWMIKNKS
jgi:hypothetical protein